MKGGVNFSGYNAKKHLQDAGGKARMAGDIFQDTFMNDGWNSDFLATNDNLIEVDRDPALDLVAQAAKEAADKK